MNITEAAYTLMVQNLFKKEGAVHPLMHASVGIASEAGELLDIAKKHLVYNKPLDLEHLIEELGDLEFYMEALRQQLGVDRTLILVENARKLRKRYPAGTYTDEHANARLDKQEENNANPS